MPSCFYQQDELYDAQEDVREGCWFDSIEEIQKFVNDLRENTWWDELYSEVEYIEVIEETERDTSSANYVAHIIYAHPDLWFERSIIHEVAHIVAHARFGSTSHDPWYARTFLELVYRVLGPGAFMQLKSGYVKFGVDHDIGRTAGQGGINT